jgi:MarR family transcriptional regulator, temperature-dependent positive regulator of motility
MLEDTSTMRDETSHQLGSSALHMLHRASQAADEMFASETTGADLTPRQFAVLAALETLESASQTRIVDLTGIDRSTLADIVKRLVKRGLLSRRRSRSDARAYVVRLTPEGKTVLLATKPAAQRVEERLLEQVPPPRRAELIAALEAIIRRLGATTSSEAA